MAFLEMRDIEAGYGSNIILKGYNLSLEKGKLLTLLGPSGCGKTTTLRVIAGFIKPRSGAVFLDGQDITHLPPYRRNIGVVFQNYALFPHMSVFENVAFGLKMRKMSKNIIKNRVDKALKMVGLEGFQNRLPKQLSGGQQQRVAIARAIVIEPELLLMDEPLSNLDAKLRMEMRGEIKALQKKLGITTVYVTHDQSEALAISDVIAVMEQGKIVQLGTPEDIYRNPDTVYVAEFVGYQKVMKGDVVEREGEKTLRSGDVEIKIDKGNPGEKYILMARRSDLYISSDGIPAEILTNVYLGDSFLYRVRTFQNIIFEVEGDVNNPMNVGSHVKIGIKRMVLFKEG